jgi:lipopolysaccharide/colanic/teichoic acid biosynthesis glycosyltransferase
MANLSTALLPFLESVNSVADIAVPWHAAPAAAPRDARLDDAAATPRPLWPRRRKRSQSTISLAQRGLAAGDAFVVPAGNLSSGYRCVKRVLDIVGALAILTLLAPIMFVVFLTLLVTTHGRPLFSQKRLGYRGRPFTMIKFRTMTLDAESHRDEIANEKDGPIFKNRQDSRITRIGRFLRSTSLDETPQLFNVLAGQMSLVGPRPAIGGEVAEYEPWQRRRLAVKPGLTCLWQVSGRSEIGFQDWVRMDLWYVRNQDLRTDLTLLAKTPWSVLSRRGAY